MSAEASHPWWSAASALTQQWRLVLRAGLFAEQRFLI